MKRIYRVVAGNHFDGAETYESIEAAREAIAPLEDGRYLIVQEVDEAVIETPAPKAVVKFATKRPRAPKAEAAAELPKPRVKKSKPAPEA